MALNEQDQRIVDRHFPTDDGGEIYEFLCRVNVSLKGPIKNEFEDFLDRLCGWSHPDNWLLIVKDPDHGA